MSGEGFLDRWSRRKRAAATREAEVATAEADARERPEAPPPSETAETPPPPDDAALTEEELAALPPVEEIDADTDLRQYLRKGVPRALRNAALRRKWLLNAAIRDHRDIAVDYAWDWNVPGGVPGDGGPLDRDTVARMAERLLAPPEPAGPPPQTSSDSRHRAAAPQDVASDSAANAVAPAPAGDAPPPPGGQPAEDSPFAAPPQTEKRAGPARDAAPRRRHGGAAPG